MEKYAVALQKQGLYAPTKVGDFTFVQEYNRHIWMSKIASDMEELAEQTNAAIKSLIDFADPWLRIEIIQVEKSELIPESSFETPRPRKLKVLGQQLVPGAIAVGQTNAEEVIA